MQLQWPRSYIMETKKNKSADLRRFRLLFFQIGLIFSLSLALWVFNLTRYGENSAFDQTAFLPEDDDILQLASLNIIPDKKVVKKEKSRPFREEQSNDDAPFKKSERGPKNGRSSELLPADEALLENPGDDELEETDDILRIEYVHETASFIGGTDAMYAFIQKELEFPREASREGISGKVVMSFVVEKDGSISHIQVLKCDPKGYGFEREAKKLLKKMSGKWKPALQADREVRMWFQLPLVFQVY